MFVEGILAFGYSIWQKKPIRPILYTSFLANLITQSLLWVVLNFFFQHYLTSLVVTEILIWIIESAMLYYVPANKLLFHEATVLSLLMNLVSFALGWFLPV